MGGLGFGTRLYLDELGSGPLPDPLDPGNPFVLMTGPVTGLRMNGVARWTVGSRSPLTGFWGEANVGGWFGALLAQGSLRAARAIGGGAEELVTTVKGLEAPMHDPRGLHGHGLAYAVSPRGACHQASLTYAVEGGAIVLPELEECAGDIEGMSSRGKARLEVVCEDYGVFFGSCAVFCALGAAVLTATQAVAMVNHATGFDYTLEEAMRVGRRAWYAKRGLSNLFGARAEHDRLPRRLATPLESGPTAGSVPDMELMLREFYEQRGLDRDGIPRAELLRNLELGDLADRLARCR